MPTGYVPPAGVWFRPKIPRDKPCFYCGMRALHRTRTDCFREIKEERAVLLTKLKQLDQLEAVLLRCPWCLSPLLQTAFARSELDGMSLRRAYHCGTCRTNLVTREAPTVTSLYISSGLAKPPKGRAGMLDWDEATTRRIMEEAAREGIYGDDEEGPDPDEEPDPP